MTRSLASVVLLFLAIAPTAARGDGFATTRVTAGAGVDGGPTVLWRLLYVRVDKDLSPRYELSGTVHAGANTSIDVPPYYDGDPNLGIELGVMRSPLSRHARTAVDDAVGKVVRARRGWRAGAYANRKVMVAHTDDSASTEGYVGSTVLGVYGGYGFSGQFGRTTGNLAFDLLAAPIVTQDEFHSRGNAGIALGPTPNSGVSRVGGRFNMLVTWGNQRMGFSVLVSTGMRPEVDRAGYFTACIGAYLGLGIR